MKDFGDFTVKKPIERAWPHFLVYEALQKSLDRIVELRVFRFFVKEGSDLLQRFRAEYDILCSLDHPNILKILDVGLSAGHAYYATPRRNSILVSELLATNSTPLSPAKVLTAARNIGDALAYIHGKKIIHRHLGLDTVFWDKSDESYYIGAFSMGRNLSKKSITARGVPHLLPLLFVPEKIHGLPFDERTDLYLLGVCLYRMLTLLWPSAAAQGQGLAEPPRPSALVRAAGGAGVQEVPTVLDDAVARLLKDDPKERFPSAKALLEALG